MASPELYPKLGEPVTEIAVYMLKRPIFSGPNTRFIEINSVIGAIWPLEVLIKMLFRSSGLPRYRGSACIITRYCLPKRLKSEPYNPPTYPCKADKTELTPIPDCLQRAAFTSTWY